MFLTKVYKHSKALFVLFVAFIIVQLFINYKQGVVASPFYHFGMYSQVMQPSEDYPVYEININGKLLEGKDFTPQQWDKIMLPIIYYAGIKTNSNQLYYQEISRMLQKINFSTSEQYYVQNCQPRDFTLWYKTYLQNILTYQVQTMVIDLQLYNFQENKLQPTGSKIPLQQLCN